MKRAFKLEGGELVDDVTHAREVMAKHPDAKIYVGTDSQNKKRYTNYAVAVVFRYGYRGAHYMYHRYKIKKIRDRWSRLWKEVELSIEVANRLKEHGIPIYAIDLDFNGDETYVDSNGRSKQAGSNMMVSSACGYCIGLGYKVIIKPEEQIAAKAADHLCR